MFKTLKKRFRNTIIYNLLEIVYNKRKKNDREKQIRKAGMLSKIIYDKNLKNRLESGKICFD